jgi:hypothetical protein
MVNVLLPRLAQLTKTELIKLAVPLVEKPYYTRAQWSYSTPPLKTVISFLDCERDI